MRHPAAEITLCAAAIYLIIPVDGADPSSRNKRQPMLEAPREYCESESFKARCWEHEVVIMRSALYGRMNIGRCVEADLGYLGCSANVLDLADRKCSGSQECDIRIPDGDLDNTKPCYKELKVYLEASYTCVRVLPQESSTCSPGNPVQVGSSPGHVLVDMATKDTRGCGSASRPWVFEAHPGQKVNLTLIDFSWTADARSDSVASVDASSSGSCVDYGTIIDPSERNNTTICGGKEREKVLHISRGNSLRMILKYPNNKAKNKFLIRYEAVGCPDLRTPKDAWLDRTENEATVGCDKTRQTWHLKCQGRQWVGVIGNCTQHLMTARRAARTEASDSPISHGVAIVLIVGIALIICAIIVSIGFVCIRRYSRRLCSKSKGQIKYNNVNTEDDNSVKNQGRGQRGQHQRTINIISSDKASLRQTPPGQTYIAKNDYSHVWDMPLPPDPIINDKDNNNPYRGSKGTATDSAYGGSAATKSGSGNDDSYHVSVTSRNTDDSRYYVLDRDAVIDENREC